MASWIKVGCARDTYKYIGHYHRVEILCGIFSFLLKWCQKGVLFMLKCKTHQHKVAIKNNVKNALIKNETK